jgi:hypothetical protein
MAVVTISPIPEVVKYPLPTPAANSLDITPVVPTVAVDGVDFDLTGREVVVIQNSAATPQTVTLKSVADARGRVGDIGPYVLQAGEFAAFIPPADGFRGGNGRCLFTMDSTSVKVLVFRVPNTL